MVVLLLLLMVGDALPMRESCPAGSQAAQRQRATAAKL
jgi:hypothetical protein